MLIAFTAGRRLGPYEILSALGAGGMGEVYRARDTHLHRDVAIKILPELFATDPDRLARFTREAQTLAALNHANVAHIYGVVERPPALVMEFADGEDLSAIILRGPLPVDEAIAIARQIAEALEAAHEQGIVHRDLKPANIKVKPDGTVKVLDFGLAKAMDPGGAAEASAIGNSPTWTARATAMGLILGTAAYMAPEQARGKAVDKRADIWSFGVVLFEMLTGTQVFGGDTISEVMAALMKDEPDWGRLPPATPPQVMRLLRRCLVKDPRHRLRDIGDARLLLDDTDAPAPSVVDARPASRTAGPILAAAVAVAVVATAGIMRFLPQAAAAPTRVARLSIPLPDGDELITGSLPPLAISPDGTRVVYVGMHDGVARLFLRNLSDAAPVALPGTENAVEPFFAPDSQRIGFFADGSLKKTIVGSSAVQVVAPHVSGPPRGGSWSADGTIYFAPTSVSSLWRVRDSGGTPTELTHLDHAHGEISQRWPWILPDGKTLLYASWSGPGLDEHAIMALTIASGERRIVSTSGDMPRYVPGGYVVYGRRGNLFALLWPPPQARLDVAPLMLPEMAMIGSEGAVDYAISNDGMLAYVQDAAERSLRQVVWIDRATRKVEVLALPPRDYTYFGLSPDGRRAVVQSAEGTVRLSIWDFARQILTSLPAEGSSQYPVWTPDSRRLIYRGTRNGSRNLYWRAADGSGGEERLSDKSDVIQTPSSVTQDGTLVFSENGPRGLSIWTMRLDGNHAAQLLLDGAMNGRVSPDGRWLAYVRGLTDDSTAQVFLRPFRGAGAAVQVSPAGGAEPLWSHDSHELFYTHGTQTLSITIGAGQPPSIGRPGVVHEGRYRPAANVVTSYDVTGDGKRFLRVQDPATSVRRIDVALNWTAEVKAAAATARH